MKMVADRHRLAAYHNKHWWQAFWIYQHRWPWTTLSPKNIDFKWFFGDFWLQKVNCNEMDGDRPRLPANRNCHSLLCVSWALAEISCFNNRYNDDNNKLSLHPAVISFSDQSLKLLLTGKRYICLVTTICLELCNPNLLTWKLAYQLLLPCVFQSGVCMDRWVKM